MGDTPPRPAIRTPPDSLGDMLGLMFGKAEAVPVFARPRLRPLGRALRAGEERAYRLGEWLEETAPARCIRLARLLGRGADSLDPRPFRHRLRTITAGEIAAGTITAGVTGEPPREAYIDTNDPQEDRPE